jgi:hypothetical protein
VFTRACHWSLSWETCNYFHCHHVFIQCSHEPVTGPYPEKLVPISTATTSSYNVHMSLSLVPIFRHLHPFADPPLSLYFPKPTNWLVCFTCWEVIDILHMIFTNNNKHQSPSQQKQSILKLLFSESLLYLYTSICSFLEFQLCFKFSFICICLLHCHRTSFRFPGQWSSDHRHTAANRSIYCRHWPYNLHG